jgi:hypothetical protein
VRSSVTRAAALAIVLAGAGLRAIQYVANSSFSLDEIALVVNVVERRWMDLLFQPLAHAQVAPVGFLFLTKANTVWAGNGEAALRLLPFLSSLASLVLFWRVSRRCLSASAAMAALAVFAVSPTLVLYAGVAKPYSGDVAIALALTWMALRFLEREPSGSRAAALGLAGGAMILLSYPAIPVAIGLGAMLLAQARRAGRPAARLLALLAGWFGGAALSGSIALATLSPATGEYMQIWWRDGFVPAPWQGVDEWLWVPARIGRILTFAATGIHPPLDTLAEAGVVGLYTVLLPIGFVRLFRRDPWIAAALAIPVGIAVGAAALRWLPLAGRVSLFLAPALLVAAVAGLDRVGDRVRQRPSGPTRALLPGLAALPAVAALVVTPPPFEQGGTRAVLEEVRARWLPGDRLVVSRGASTFRLVGYYGDLLGLEGWVPLDRLEGRYSEEEILRSYLRRIEAYRGSPRVWFHLEGTTPCEDEAILGYLDSVGERIHAFEAHLEWGHRISAHLFDLSGPVPRSTATAEDYALPDCAPGSTRSSPGSGNGGV